MLLFFIIQGHVVELYVTFTKVQVDVDIKLIEHRKGWPKARVSNNTAS